MKPYIILSLNTSRKHVNYEEDKIKVSIPMNKPYNIQNTNICMSQILTNLVVLLLLIKVNALVSLNAKPDTSDYVHGWSCRYSTT